MEKFSNCTKDSKNKKKIIYDLKWVLMFARGRKWLASSALFLETLASLKHWHVCGWYILIKKASLNINIASALSVDLFYNAILF